MQNNLNLFITIGDDLQKHSHIYFNSIYTKTSMEKSLFILNMENLPHYSFFKNQAFTNSF